MDSKDPRFTIPESPEVLEDILADALEMACKVPPEGRKLLLAEIRKKELEESHISLNRGLTVAKLMIIVAEIMDIEEFWIYHPRTHTMRKIKGRAEKIRPFTPDDWLLNGPKPEIK